MSKLNIAIKIWKLFNWAFFKKFLFSISSKKLKIEPGKQYFVKENCVFHSVHIYANLYLVYMWNCI